MSNYRDKYYIYNELDFPRHIRAYFDYCSDEFKYISVQDKLLDIAYLFLNGYDVKKSIHEVYTKHTVSEYTVQRTLYILLQELIGFEETHKLKANIKSTDNLIDVFLGKLLRYYHLPNDKSNKHYIQNPDSVSIEELKATNPWSEVAMKYNRNDFILSKEENLIYSLDKDIVEDHNKSVCSDYRYHLNLPVYPWYGNPLESSVIVLSLNPAWSEKQDKLSQAILKLPVGLVEGFACHLRSMLTFDCVGFLPPINSENSLSYRDVANIHQSWYWWDRLEKAFGVPELNLNMEDVNSKFAVIQYVAYSSNKYKAFKGNKILPSQYYTRQLIEWILRNKPNTIFIIPRNIAEWKRFLSDLWEDFSDRFICTPNNRVQSLTRKVIDNDKTKNDFDKIIAGLK